MKLYKNLKIRTKYFLPVLAISIGFLLVVIYGIKALDNTSDSMVNFIDGDQSFLLSLSQMYAQGLQSEQATRNVLLNPSDNKAKENYKKANSDFAKHSETAKKSVDISDEELQKIKDIENLWSEIDALKQSVQNLAVAGNPQAGIELLNSKETKKWRELKDILLKLMEEKQKDVLVEKNRVQDQTEASFNNMLLYSGIIMIISFVILFFAANAFVKPIKVLETAANKVSSGDTSVSIQNDSGDEVGSLSRSFNVMVENVRKSLDEVHQKSIIAENAAIEAEQQRKQSNDQKEYLRDCVQAMLVDMDKFSNGDLTVRLQCEKHDELITKLFTGFNNTVLKIKDTITKVSEAVQAAASAANQISSSAEEMAAGAQEQSSQTAEVAAAVEQMTKTIVETTRNTENVSLASKQAGKTANEGGAVVNKTIEGMNRIEEVVRRSAETVQELGKSSDQIGDIAQVIDDIADQTNLLALNAAIEAARAGEQGRGFAVVADEVRKLAERTTKATKEIAEMIKRIQSDTYGAVDSMAKGKEEVEQGKQFALKAGDSLKEIINGANSVVDLVVQVAAASEEQSSTAEEISKNIEAINNVIHESAQGIQQIAMASEHLSKLTNNLQNIVSQFKIEKHKKSFVTNENGELVHI